MRSDAPSWRLGTLALFTLASFVAAAVGGLATATALPTWYRGLRKPTWNPPDGVFGPVWTVLYVSMAVAAWLIRRGMDTGHRKQRAGGVALQLWWLQLALNLGWSLAFFGRRRPDWGLAIIGLLELTILATTLAATRVSAVAAALLTPYAVWTAFAATLNLRIWQLNRTST